MTQEDKELLLKDLSARLPYGLYATVRDPEENDDFQPFEVLGIKEDLVWVRNTMIGVDHFDTIEVVKPYLRPMSSMTEEEKKEFDDFCVIDEFAWKGNSEIGYKNQAIIMSDAIDWLLKKHFDYRGLIEKELAIEAPEGMYEK